MHRCVWLLIGCVQRDGLATLGARPARIGILDTGFAGSTAQPIDALIEGLRQLGHVEGDNLIIEYRFAEGREDRLPELAAQLASVPVDVIVATTTQGARAAAETAATVPFVFTRFLQDPVAAGLVDSLARPCRRRDRDDAR